MQKRLDRMTWKEVGQLDHPKTVALLPVGAVEAHGPHLPITTDVIIANAMAESAAKELDSRGKGVLLLPPISYSSARYAAGFAGTISIQPETATAVLVDIGRALAAQGFRTLGIANAHLEPSHIGSIIKAVKTLREEGALTVIFPDVTRKPWALRLTEEFKSGACHAGQYEGSIVMAEKPEWVREEIRKALPPNPASLPRSRFMGGSAHFLRRKGFLRGARRILSGRPVNPLPIPTGFERSDWGKGARFVVANIRTTVKVSIRNIRRSPVNCGTG